MSHQQHAPAAWHVDGDSAPSPAPQMHAHYFESACAVDYDNQQQHGFELLMEMAGPPPLTAALPVAPWPVASQAACDSAQQQQRVDGEYAKVADFASARVGFRQQQQQQVQRDRAVPSPGQTSSAYSSYSSTHRSSEDDDEMGVWVIIHQGDGEGGGDDDTKRKEAVAQRRIRNRESMRRSRTKEKEALTTLRATLTDLEVRFMRLTKWDSASNSDPRRCSLVQQKLAYVVQLKRELEAEKDVVLHFLEEKRASVGELQRVLVQCQLEDHDGVDAQRTAEKLALLEEQAHKHSLSSSAAGTRSASSSSSQPYECGFTALSTAQINELLTAFCADLQHVKELARTMTPHEDVAHPFLEVFGWQTHRHIDTQSQMHFEFVKAFPHLSTQEIVDRAWRDAVDLIQYKKKHKRHNNIRRIDFLQRVDEHLGIIVREIKHPTENTIFRTHYALFMLESPEGFLCGIQSINPTAEQQQQLETHQQRTEACDDDGDGLNAVRKEKVVWVDASISIEFQRQPRGVAVEWPLSSSRGDHSTSSHVHGDDGSRQDYCEVRWRGKTNYKTSKHAAENALGFLLGILKWENDVVGPRFHLTAS